MVQASKKTNRQKNVRHHKIPTLIENDTEATTDTEKI